MLTGSRASCHNILHADYRRKPYRVSSQELRSALLRKEILNACIPLQDVGTYDRFAIENDLGHVELERASDKTP